MRDMALLSDSFRPTAEQLIYECKQPHGIIVRPFFTVRDVWEQARLWRQSRAWPEIEAAVAMLRTEGAPWLADVLEGVGPQYGRWATNALPGQSWHQWGEAMDCFVLEDGGAVWDGRHQSYLIYAIVARRLGLTAGYWWPKRPDAVHVQRPKENSPATLYPLSEINRVMEQRYRKAA